MSFQAINRQSGEQWRLFLKEPAACLVLCPSERLCRTVLCLWLGESPTGHDGASPCSVQVTLNLFFQTPPFLVEPCEHSTNLITGYSPEAVGARRCVLTGSSNLFTLQIRSQEFGF